ncbi:hypothetical protein DI383_02225 [Flavobacteriaceae bacterium LYZ1037]|nr:hypothetical protein DI383_02225 [Flavobacteriaceae bacterium LYZ1037]
MISIKQFKKKLKPKIIHLALLFKNYRMGNAILIFSEARGGSTWLMELLKNIPGVIINWEPLHVNKGVVPKAFKFGWRPYLPVDTKDGKYMSLFSNIFILKIYNKWTTRFIFWKDLKKSKHVLTKFVRANQSLPWVVNTFPKLNHKPIFLLRHPITTCVSRLKSFEGVSSGSISKLKHDANFVEPDCINNERFILHKEYINNLKTKLEVEIAIWCINNANIIVHKDRNKWLTVYYEDLVLYPMKTIQTTLKGINIKFEEGYFENINFSKPSISNYQKDFKPDPVTQLEYFFNIIKQNELQRIQDIFDYFELKAYSAFSAYPIK